MCDMKFVAPARSSGRLITVEDDAVIYVAKRGERSPSDSNWLIPGKLLAKSPFADPAAQFNGDYDVLRREIKALLGL